MNFSLFSSLADIFFVYWYNPLLSTCIIVVICTPQLNRVCLITFVIS